MRDNSDYITYSQLSERHAGWTRTNVKNFADPPDLTKRNPHYRSASPTRLYRTSRIEEVEQREDVQAALKRGQLRSERATLVSERTRLSGLMKARAFSCTVPEIPQEQLKSLAIEHYNSRLKLLGGENYVFLDHVDPTVLNRITVNYVRHELSRYDNELSSIKGKVGRHEIHAWIKRRVLEEIARVYPYLNVECERQMPEGTGRSTLEYYRPE